MSDKDARLAGPRPGVPRVSALLRALEERAAAGNPIRVGLVGAGFAGRGFAARVIRRTPGMRARRGRQPDDRARPSAPTATPASMTSSASPRAAELDAAIAAGRPAVTDDPTLLTDAAGIDVIVEATGEVEFGARRRDQGASTPASTSSSSTPSSTPPSGRSSRCARTRPASS